MKQLHPEIMAALKEYPFQGCFILAENKNKRCVTLRIIDAEDVAKICAYLGHKCGENIWKNLRVWSYLNAFHIHTDIA